MTATAAPRAEAPLAPNHQALIDASAIDPGVARERGYRTLTAPREATALGFADYQARTPALLVPVYGPDGALATHQLRPDDPRLRDGKPLKYETPAGSGMVLDVPRRVRRALGNPKVRLYITEGARKVDAGVSIGLCVVGLLGVDAWRGTNADGGKTALAAWEVVALNGREVVLVFDSDVVTKPDVRRALDRLAAFLAHRGAKVRAVQLPGGAEGKTGLDDWLAADTARTERDLLALPDVAPDPAAAGPRLQLVDLSTVVAKPVEYANGRTLVRGALQITAGDPGLGKSRMNLGAVAAVTLGLEWPPGPGGRVQVAEPGNVLYVGSEDSLERVVRPVVDCLGGDASRVRSIAALETFDKKGNLRVRSFGLSEDGLAALEKGIRAHRPALVVIDPLTAYLDGADSFKDAEVRERLTPVAQMADAYDVVVLGNGHMNKDQQKAVAYRLGGAVAFYAVARAVFFVVKDPDDPRRRVLFQAKGNMSALTDARGFSIVGARHSDAIPDVGIPAWDAEPVGFTLEDALQAQADAGRGKQEKRPETVLRCLLLGAGGSLPSEEVYRLAEVMGVSRRTLERVKAELGVVSKREGLGPGSVSHWQLPAAAHRDGGAA